MKNIPTVLLISGGQGCEREVSLAGAEYLRGLIDREKYRLIEVNISPLGGWFFGDEAVYPIRLGDRRGLWCGGKILRIDCAFPLLHGDYGEDGRIQGALDTAGIPFVGCDTVSGAVCSDKSYSRAVAESLGVPVAGGIPLPEGLSERELIEMARELGYPLFFKPKRLGSSVGATPVYNDEQLYGAYVLSCEISSGGALIEELIEKKRELEVGVLYHRGRRIISPVGEVRCEGFYDYRSKYRDGGSEVTARADIDESVERRILDYTERLTSELCPGGLCRVDFFLSGERILFNEINTMPGFTQTSLYPRLMAEAGISPEALCEMLIAEAIGGGI